MMIFDNVYASIYRVFKGKKLPPYTQADSYHRLPNLSILAENGNFFVSGIMVIVLYMIVLVAEKVFQAPSVLFKGFYLRIGAVVVFLAVPMYYSKKRTSAILEKFENKSLTERKLWGWFTAFLIAGPSIVIAFLANR
jgi:hypothetical protein